jgi:hypothetical protein
MAAKLKSRLRLVAGVFSLLVLMVEVDGKSLKQVESINLAQSNEIQLSDSELVEKMFKP